MSLNLNKKKKEKLKKFIIFGIVGGVGTVVNTGILWALTNFGMFYIYAAIIATEAAIISNFIGNNVFTFKNNKDPSSLGSKFLKFQLISVITIIGTVTILWILTTNFGEELLLVWNLIAIVVMFVLNFILNSKFTWRDKKFVLLFILILVPLVSSQVSVSQMGYHPDSLKQAIVYTHETTGNFVIKNLNQETVYSGIFGKAKDYHGNEVECQGNNPCLVGNFSGFKMPGEYYLIAEIGEESYESYDFVINSDIYKDNSDVFFEFFNAMQQQNSEYHNDFHKYLDPSFIMTTDGSFLMPSEDASVVLISLGKAYSRNPEFFDNDVNSNGKKDITENIEIYINYLKNLQGLELEDSSEGFRTGETIRINNLFVPGHLSESPYLEEIDGEYKLRVYAGGNEISGSPFEVVSLCGNLEGEEYSICLDDALQYYKTQEDEPGVNISYIGPSKEVASRNVETNGYGVTKGWYYEFGCYFDVNLEENMFGNDYNPCMVFDEEENVLTTSKALYGFLVSVPAIYDESESEAKELVDYSIKTYDYIENNYVKDAESVPYIGASLFLLYDYTGDLVYLEKAYSLREDVEKSFSLWNHDKDFYYWEEYIKHKQDIENNSLLYTLDGQNPEELLRGHMFYEYQSDWLAISKNGERVVERYRSGYDFSNSRAILITGNFAAKTIDLYENYLNEDYEDFFRVIPDSQISWLTGANVVQPSVSKSSIANESFSFIFGIGDNNPQEYHSRYLIDTGISSESNGKFIGIRGTGYKFYNGSELIYLDGYQEIMGYEFGAMGNNYNGEPKRQIWDADKTFNNGKKDIPGWINGPYDHSNDNDVIFNYDDSRDTYEFTESTNEMVATAIELFSYQDAYYNNKPRHSLKKINLEINNATLKINSNVEAQVIIDGESYGLTPVDISLLPGSYEVVLSATGYISNATNIELLEGEVYEHNVFLEEEAIENATIHITSNPSLANVELNGKSYGLTPVNISLLPESYEVSVFLESYEKNVTVLNLLEGEIYEHKVVLKKNNSDDDDEENNSNENETINGTLEITSTPEAEINIDNIFYGVTPQKIELEPGSYEFVLSATGYYSNTTIIELLESEVYEHNVILEENISNEENNSNGDENETNETINGTISITSNPSLANVYVDGESYGITPVDISLLPGSYEVVLSATGYYSNTTIIELLESEVYEHNVILEENISNEENNSNGDENDTTPPSSISDLELLNKNFDWISWTWTNPLEEDFDENIIYINEVNRVNTSNNYYNATSLSPDTEYTIKVHTKDIEGNINSINIYDTQVTEKEDEKEDENEINQTPENTITFYHTNLLETENSLNNAEYFMYETENAYFSVTSDDLISWKVNGKEVATTSQNHEFEWNPGILYSGGQKFTYAEISASSKDDTVIWKIDVRDVINPFFDPDSGNGNTVIHVYTYDDYQTYDNLSVKITNPTITSSSTYELEPFQAQNNETEWKRSINFGQSYTHHLVEIAIKKGDEIKIYNLDLNKLGYYKNPPEGGSTGGGGRGGSVSENIELVYVVLDKILVNLNGSIDIELDAKSERGIKKIEAVFLIPDGNLYTQELELSQGTEYYGTWKKSMNNFPMTGLYELYEIKIEGYEKEIFNPEESRSFYVVSDLVDNSEELGLVYTALSESEVNEEKNVSLTLDARDAKGVTSVEAYIEIIRSGVVLDSFVLPLKLIEGNENYGTWQENILVKEGDSTYELKTITLTNQEKSKEIPIENREVYATSNLPVTMDEDGPRAGITGMAIALERLRKPLFPLGIAFIILVIAALLFLINNRGMKDDE